MKKYPEPTGRAWDIAEQVLMALVAAGMIAALYFSIYFACNILGE